jgi:hypothetical protein
MIRPPALAILLWAIASFGWSQDEDPFAPLGERSIQQVAPAPKKPARDSNGNLYAPVGTDSWSANYLAAMGVPSLCVRHQGDPKIYFRFTWLRTFHHPISITLEVHGDESMLWVIELSGKGGYDPGIVASERRVSVPQDSAGKLKEAFERPSLWAPLSDFEAAYFDSCKDGALWLLESSAPEAYRRIELLSPPDPQDAIAGMRDFTQHRALVKCLLGISGLSVPETEFY